MELLVLSYGQKLKHELEGEMFNLNMSCLWKLPKVLVVSSLVSSHPWVYVFDYVRQHNYFSFHDYEIRLENPLYHS